jgi:hypothetical protein
MADTLGIGTRRVPIAADRPPIALSRPMPGASSFGIFPAFTSGSPESGLPDDLNDSWRLPEQDLVADVAQSRKRIEDELLVEVAHGWKKHSLPGRRP